MNQLISKEFLNAVFTKANITFAIAVAGFGLSVCNAARDWLSNRKNISVSAPFAFCHEDNAGYSFIMIEFVNHSKLPITITRIQATIDGKCFELGQESVRMFEFTHPERKGRVADDSALLPISINSLGYAKALFSIENWPQISQKLISLEIDTNRGTLRKSVEISDVVTDFKTMHKRLG